MRLCVPVPCFFNTEKTDFCEALRQIAAIGYDAVETYDWTKLDLENVRKTLEETGLELISICTTDFRLTSPEHRETWLSGLRESCITAKKLGVRHLITQVGNDTGAPREEQRCSVVEGLRAGVPVLEEYGVTVMIEPLNILVDHPGYFLWSSAEAFDIVKEVGSENVKVVYDIYHQQISEGNIIPTVLSNLEYIAHLHGAGHPGRGELQSGESDYGVIINAIDRAGYKGALGLEYFTAADPVESLTAAKIIYG